ncbi:MAG: hypothetical protein GX936_00130 [Clostridiales bacterium]|nr:hypothetical protein [Clostridiales bacterium]
MHGFHLSVTTPGVTVKYRTTDSGEYNLSEAPIYQNVGTYTVWYRITKNHYTTIEGSTVLQITPKLLTVNVTVRDKSYDGLSTATFEGIPALVGVVGDDAVTLVPGTPAFTDVRPASAIPISFTDFSITGEDAGNYTLTQPSGITAAILQGFTPVQNTHYTLTAAPSSGWLATDFVITAKSGYALSLTDTSDGTWQESLRFADETAAGNAAFYVKNTVTGEISAMKTEGYRIDKTNPTGKITVKANSWTQFLNSITFGLFYKNTVQVSIEGNDAGSGVESVGYYKAASPLPAVTDWNALAFTAGDSFSVQANEKLVIYARVTDQAGNRTVVSSDGIVVYTDAAKDTEAIRYTRFGPADVTAKVTLNGNTVAGVNDGSRDLILNTDYTAEGNTIAFKAAYLNSLSAGEHTLTLRYHPLATPYTDAAGNDAPAATTLALTVEKAVPTVSLTADTSNKTLTASVSGVTGHTPSGSVEFFDGTTSLGSASLDTSGSAVLSVTLADGAHQLKAVYGGDSGYTGAEASLQVTQSTGNESPNTGDRTRTVLLPILLIALLCAVYIVVGCRKCKA